MALNPLGMSAKQNNLLTVAELSLHLSRRVHAALLASEEPAQVHAGPADGLSDPAGVFEDDVPRRH